MTFNATPLKRSAGNIGPWANLDFFQHGQFAKVCERLQAECRPVWPEPGKILRAYELVQPDDVRVVILGQDPYPQPNRATGLAFAVPPAQMPARGSLPNIFEKVRSDPGIRRTTPRDPAANSELTGWAHQGVMLLNTALTVPQNRPGAHGGIGWSPLISQTLGLLAERPDIAWLVCGYRARQRLSRLHLHGLAVQTGHPSRKSLFAAAHPFSSINRFLGDREIDWWRT